MQPLIPDTSRVVDSTHKRALICGVSGQDGSYMAALLLKKGYEVFGTSRDLQTTSFDNHARLGIKEHIKVERMTPQDPRDVMRVLRSVQPDEVYNFSGQSSVGLSFDQPVETLESNLCAATNLLEAIRFADRPIRLLNAGSGECYGDSPPSGATERCAFRPRSPYSVAKAAAHWMVVNYRDAYGVHASNAILFNHESPLRPERFVTRKVVGSACRISRGASERLMLGNLRIKRDWGWAPEYVDAMWRILQQERGDDFVIATGESHSLEDFVKEAFEQVGLDWREHTDVSNALLRPSDLAETRGNPAKAARVLGWTARHRMKDVVARMVRAELDPAAVIFDANKQS